jgi:hypothetical protein
MTENVETAIFEILKSIQTKLAEHDRRFDQLERRFDTADDLMRKQRRDMAGILVIGNSTAGNFAEQQTALEKWVPALEGSYG